MPALKLGAMSVLEAEQVLLDMLKKKAELERRIPEVASFINANRPINQLPVEILVTIFDLVHGGLPYMMCIISSPLPPGPKLWWLVHVVPEIRADVLKFVLSKSGNCPVDVILEGLEDAKTPTETLLDHSSRIATLHIQDVSRTQADILSKLVHQHMPTLTELRIWLDPWKTNLIGEVVSEAEVFMLDIHTNSHPKLSTLSLRAVGLDGLDNGAVPCLTELELRDIITPDCAINDFMRFLQSCPALKSLTLVRFRPHEPEFDVLSDPNDFEALPIVTFTSTLRALFVEDLDVYAARLLTAFSVPVSTHVTVIKLVDLVDSDELRTAAEVLNQPFYSCLPADRSKLPIFQRICRAYISQDSVDRSLYFVASADEHTGRVSIGVKDSSKSSSPRRNLPLEVATLLAQSPLTDLCIDHLRDIGPPREQDRWSRALEPLTEIRKLAVFASDRHGQRVALNVQNSLAPVMNARAADGTPLCPHLEELALSYVPSSENELQFPKALDSALRERETALGHGIKLLYIELVAPSPYNSLEGGRISRRTQEVIENNIRAVLSDRADAVQCSYDRRDQELEQESAVLGLQFNMYGEI
ncbi:hypothetical protein C8Q76DRAFT_801575 [Earliella scabrosa]|nr:hypothetical protein C8Q76DRAFT_801575 [Earliella scabrosa]